MDSAGLDGASLSSAELLIDCVAGGASVGFLPPSAIDAAGNYWRRVAGAIEAGTRVLLAALEDGRLRGTVQLDLPGMANGRHRAEVMKLLVSTQARGRGIGAKLMERVESAARERGRSLLALDTKTGDAAEQLYRKIGHETAGHHSRLCSRFRAHPATDHHPVPGESIEHDQVYCSSPAQGRPATVAPFASFELDEIADRRPRQRSRRRPLDFPEARGTVPRAHRGDRPHGPAPAPSSS